MLGLPLRAMSLVGLLGVLLPVGCGKPASSADFGNAGGTSGSAGAGAAAHSGAGGVAVSGGTGGAAGASGGSAGSAGSAALATVSVLTQHNDIARSGTNLKESVLNATNVASPAFGKLFVRAVDDQIYAQPLIVPNLEIPGKGKHNVVYVATVAGSVYAFDADMPSESDPLWKTNLVPAGGRPTLNTDMNAGGTPAGACSGNYVDFSGNMGIAGTPVIDDATGTLYVVVRTVENNEQIQRFHALDIRDGSPKPNSPVKVDASVPGTGDASVNGVLKFQPLYENQRLSLLLLNGVVYVGWSGQCDWGPYHGWLMGYDAKSLAQVVVYSTTPDGHGGGIWQSGQGPASDGTSLFILTGNGTIGTQDGDPRSLRNRGHSFLKLSRDNASSLKIDTWFTPYNYEYLNYGDLDLGSAGMTFVPGTRLAIAGGKGSWLYVVDRENMGGLTGSTVTDDNIIQSFNVNAPYHIHGSPLFWTTKKGGRLFVWAEEDKLKAYPYLGEQYAPGSKVFDTDHVETSLVQAPHQGIAGKLLMPGGVLSLSANGSVPGTGIIWASHQFSGDANNEVRPGILRAINAEDITQELWNSENNPALDDCGKFAKFSAPTVANGKVYLASFSNQLCVYGLK
jgi:hypothetical protein